MQKKQEMVIDAEALKQYARPKSDLAYRALVHIRDKYAGLPNPPSPEIGLFLSVFENDIGGINEALRQGADRNKRLGQVFRQHSSLLEDFHAFGLESEVRRGVDGVQRAARSLAASGLAKGG